MRVLAFLLALGAVCGCVRRTIDITSEPEGALVWVNDREVGRTPCSIDFTHYGRYDVRLRRDGYEPVSGFGDADAPVWDFVGADLVAEVLPANLTSRVQWKFTMIPTDTDEAAMLARARAMRERLAQSAEVETTAPQELGAAGPAPSKASKAEMPVPSSVLQSTPKSQP
jgi:hypothetical protein